MKHREPTSIACHFHPIGRSKIRERGVGEIGWCCSAKCSVVSKYAIRSFSDKYGFCAGVHCLANHHSCLHSRQVHYSRHNGSVTRQWLIYKMEGVLCTEIA